MGKPKDGEPRACVTIVEITPQAAQANFLRVEYDLEKSAAAIIKKISRLFCGETEKRRLTAARKAAPLVFPLPDPPCFLDEPKFVA